MSCHLATARLSPYHWWASSCTTTASPACGVLKKACAYTGLVWFSSAKPKASVLSTMPPAAVNG
jgi:hypothetical protein